MAGPSHHCPREYSAGIKHSWIGCPSNSPTLAALVSRVARLEAQLLEAKAGKTKSERDIQYILQGLINSDNNVSAFIKPIKAASTLHYKLKRIREENRSLKVKLRLVLQLLANHHGCASSSNHQLKATLQLDGDKVSKLPEPQTAEGLLIDLSTPSEPTAVGLSDNNTISFVQPPRKEETGGGVDEMEEGETSKKEITSSYAVDLCDTPYIYRFGHGDGNIALSADLGSERYPVTHVKRDEKRSTLAPELQPSTRASNGKTVSTCSENDQALFSSLKEIEFAATLPSLNASFSSASTIAVPNKDAPTETSFTSLPYTKESMWPCTAIFSSSWEREQVIHYHKQHTGSMDLQFPDLFRYGICFKPNRGERDVYRTILISGIPSDTTMTALLDHVRGGMIIEAKILNTENITRRKTAWIIFQREAAAMAFEEYAGKHPITFKGNAVHVTILATPTWPIPVMLQKAIKNHQHTRCLEIHKFPRYISPTVLRRNLRICSVLAWDAIEHMSLRADGVLELRFSSVRYAGQAYGILTTHSGYRHLVTQFVPDPCAQPSQMAANGKATDLRKKFKEPIDLDSAQYKGDILENEPAAIDQSGRLEKIQCDDIDHQYAPAMTMRGRGLQSID